MTNPCCRKFKLRTAPDMAALYGAICAAVPHCYVCGRGFSEVNGQKNTIQSLQTLLVSLQEVPSRVQKIQENLDETGSQLQELARLREEVADQKCTILTLQAALDAEKQNASNWYQVLRKKNQMTVILAGSAIFLAAAEFLLLVVGVL